MKKKTTNHHFRLFKSEIENCLKDWMIADWTIGFTTLRLNERYANSSFQLGSRKASFGLCQEWDDVDGSYLLNDDNIKTTARHEALHLLLAPMGVLMDTRYVTEDETMAAEHSVVMRLLKLLFPTSPTKL